MSAISLTYDNFSMQDEDIVTSDINLYSAPALNIQASKIAQKDGSNIVNTQYEPKIIEAEGYIKGATISEFEQTLDLFKKALNKQAVSLDIDYGGGTRRYIATTQNVVINRPRGLNYCTFSVEFYCAKPYGSDISTSTMLNDSTTNASDTFPLTVGGSYKAEPVIEVTLNSGTGLTTDKTITISNGNTFRGLSVTRDWTASDTLEIDSFNKTVFVNSETVEYSGLFPEFEAGSQSLQYIDDFTTRDVDIVITYTKRYL